MGFHQHVMASSKKKQKDLRKNHRRPKELKEVDREEEEHNSNLSATKHQIWSAAADRWMGNEGVI